MYELDKKDKDILAELQKNCRQSTRTLGRKLGMPRHCGASEDHAHEKPGLDKRVLRHTGPGEDRPAYRGYGAGEKICKKRRQNEIRTHRPGIGKIAGSSGSLSRHRRI